MGRLDNTRRIVKEDYDNKYDDLIDKLAFVLNSFMEQTVNEVNGNLDQTNLKSDIITITMTVDANGLPIGNNLIKSTVIRPTGTTVINSINVTNGNVYPTSQPYITFSTNSNSKIMKVLNISGLQASNKYQLTIKVE